MRHVVILTLDSTNMLSLAAAVDPLRAANRQAGRPCYHWTLATPKDEAVTLTSGIQLPAEPVARIAQCDILIVVAGFHLQAQAQPPLLASLRRLAGQADWTLAIDGGPWLLAAAGLLHQKTATTHWEDLETFSIQFPDVDVINARYAVSGTTLTSGGAAPALDMMLQFLTWELGVTIAARVAGGFIHAAQPSASDPQMRPPPHLPRDPLIQGAHALMETHLEEVLSLPDIADRLGVSLRTLQNRFKVTVSISPKTHYLNLRLTEADRLLRDTDLALRDIALRTGFAAPAHLSRAVKRQFGQTPSQRRQNLRPRR